MPCGWEGNRKSGVAAAMRHIRPTLVTVRCLLKAGLRAICSAAVSYFIFIFKDAYKTSYLKKCTGPILAAELSGLAIDG